MELNIIHLEQNKNIKIEYIQFQKMLFIFNAINDGWIIKKDDDSYVFTKPHHDKREIFKDEYLSTFLKQHFNTDNLLS